MNRVTAILIAIAVMASLFTALFVVIVAAKARRQWVESRRRRRRARLEPVLLRYASSPGGTLAEMLGGAPGGRDLDVLEWILLDHVQAVRGQVQERVVAAFEELGLVDRAMAAFDARRSWTRAEAAEKLGQMRSSRAAGALVRAMDDPAPEVRLRAARALGILRGSAAVSKLITSLQEPNRWSAMRIADILAGMGEEAVEGLLAELPRLPGGSRVLVIDIFGRARSLKAIPALRELLRDPDPDVRARAAHALGQIADTGAVSGLVSALSDPRWPVRAMAAKALGRIPGDGAIDALCRSLTDSQWWVRANAAEALKGKGERGHRALVEMLDSPDAYAREQAVLMLQESGILDEYVGKLGGGEPAERERAAGVIGRLVALKRTDRLREMAVDHPDREIRSRLARLLAPPLRPAGEGA